MEKMTFEEKMERLKSITTMLENNTTALEESISLYEEGLKLIKNMQMQLDSFNDRLEKISEDNKSQPPTS